MQGNNPVFEHFASLLQGVLAEVDPKGHEERRAAFQAFCDCGLPHRKVEAWKYTDVNQAVTGPFHRPSYAPLVLSGAEAIERMPISVLPDVGKDQPFALLSRALSHGGVELTVPEGVEIDKAIEIDLPVAAPNDLLCPALIIRVGAGSRVDFLVRSTGRGEGSLASWLVQLDVGEKASVSVTKISSGKGAEFCHMQTRQESASHLALFDATIGGSLTRNDLTAVLAGENAEIALNGLYAVSGKEHADHHTTIEHAVPNTRSRQLYKGIISGEACGVFNGRIVVKRGARGADALQMNRNLLCSRTAMVDSKPQLEIDNDDVRCSHGATIGRLDEAQIFYLKSRGLEPREAEAILARGFAGEVIDRIRNPVVRATLHQLVGDFFDRKEAEVGCEIPG